MDFSVITKWFNDIEKVASSAKTIGTNASASINTKVISGNQFFVGPKQLDLSKSTESLGLPTPSSKMK